MKIATCLEFASYLGETISRSKVIIILMRQRRVAIVSVSVIIRTFIIVTTQKMILGLREGEKHAQSHTVKKE